MPSTATSRQSAYVLDFNDRRVRERSIASLVALPWDGPQGFVQEIDLAGNRAYVTFESAPERTGWYPSREVC